MATRKDCDVISPSLLDEQPLKAGQKKHEKSPKRFTLRVQGWNEKENLEPLESAPKKKLKLSLTKPESRDLPENRWSFVSEDQEEALSRKYVPKNTTASTKWATGTFFDWMQNRNERFIGESDKQVPKDLLESDNAVILCKWLKLFVAEARKKDGNRYPSKTIYLLLTGILRYMRANNARCPNFLDTNNSQFASLHNALDNVFRELRTTGVDSTNKATEIFSKDEENKLWEVGVLGSHNPKALFRAVFFLNGKNFCLRGGEEHRNLKLSQVKRYSDPDHFIYTENSLKNRSGGLAQMRVSNKTVPIYASPDTGFRCHVHILDTYFSKLPKDAWEKDSFYVQPLAAIPKNPDKAWFSNTAIGRNTLAKAVKDICTEGEISGHKTNHSLRATGCSELFQSGVPEKVIQQRTGHLSLQGMRQYERTTTQQHNAVSRILNSDKNTTFEKELALCEVSKTGEAAGISSQTFRSTHAKISMSSRPIPPLQPSSGSMQFNGCSVAIYQGNSTPSATPAPPPPTLNPPHGSTDTELDGLDWETFSDF